MGLAGELAKAYAWSTGNDKALQIHAGEEDNSYFYSRGIRATTTLVENNALLEKEGVDLCDLWY